MRVETASRVPLFGPYLPHKRFVSIYGGRVAGNVLLLFTGLFGRIDSAGDIQNVLENLPEQSVPLMPDPESILFA